MTSDQLTAVEQRRVDEVRAARRSEATHKRYQDVWDRFSDWLSLRGVVPTLPVHPDLVATYVVELADREYSFSTIDLAISGISARHRDSGFDSPTGGVAVREVRAGLRRVLGDYHRQARPLFAADIAAIRETSCIPRPSNHGGYSKGGYEKLHIANRRGKVDIALVTTMFDGLLRVSEAAELRWHDITQMPNGSGIITIRFSKGDQKGLGTHLWLSPATMEALNSIRPTNVDDEARVFR